MSQVDFVIPLFNEEESVSGLHQLLEQTSLPDRYARNYIFVNDGSIDRTQQVLEELADKHSNVRIIQFSRNFGHQAALSAGLEAAAGDIVITMDGDGQHPPSIIPEMLRLHKAGYDIVQAQRLDQPGAGFLKRVTSAGFYRLLTFVGEVDLMPGTSDFRLLSRKALDALKGMPEYHRFLRGMIVWIGFPGVVLPYKPAQRMGGVPKYSFKKMMRLAGDGFFSFSLVPLRIGLFLGAVFIALAAVELSYVAWVWFAGHRDQLVPGWTSVVLILTVSSAINMILQGILGIYLGMVFREVKRRPVYIIRSQTQPKS